MWTTFTRLTNRTRLQKFVVVIALLAAASAGFFATLGVLHARRAERYIEGAAGLPFATLQDWVSYADYVVTVKVDEESRAPLTKDETRSGEGMQVRLVNLRVENVVWQSDKAAEVPEQFMIPQGGWLIHEASPDERLFLDDSVDLQVGHEYLLPITHDDSESLAWQALAPEAIEPFDGGMVGSGKAFHGGSSESSAARVVRSVLQGANATRVSNLLRLTKVDARLTPYLDLPPRQRYQAYLKATLSRTESGQPAAGEKP